MQYWMFGAVRKGPPIDRRCRVVDPSFQLADDRLDESIHHAAAGGADGVNIFMYQGETVLRPESFAR
jgi:hypothetical protein